MRRLSILSLFAAFLVSQTASQAALQDPTARTITRVPIKAGDSTSSISVPRGYAVVIGVAKYQNLDNEAQLQFSETDADEISRVLISQQGGAFPAENVHRLIGKQASFANIRHELEEWLPSVAQESDRVVVYFAGHGLTKGGKG